MERDRDDVETGTETRSGTGTEAVERSEKSESIEKDESVSVEVSGEKVESLRSLETGKAGSSSTATSAAVLVWSLVVGVVLVTRDQDTAVSCQKKSGSHRQVTALEKTG